MIQAYSGPLDLLARTHLSAHLPLESQTLEKISLELPNGRDWVIFRSTIPKLLSLRYDGPGRSSSPREF